MSTSTDSLFISSIAPAAQMSLGYALLLATDIPEDRWADSVVTGMNHPAFLYGHLGSYSNRILAGFLGREDLVTELPYDGELVKAGAECLDDPSLYPGRDVVLPYFQQGYETVIGVLPEISPDVLAAENPAEGRFREMLPTVGAAVNFMLNNHVMMHAGQISHWRRAIGLGPVM
ncbi:MAG: hypothetical protein CMJ23_01755 [Phycisphaerae bacterium]|nr:hypothetical protein [Phycisphaerae bacterium]